MSASATQGRHRQYHAQSEEE